MDDNYLYEKISEAIRQDVYSGVLKFGDALPTMREMAIKWGCTIGTIQRAYRELAHQGLVESHVGRGTKVAINISAQDKISLRSTVLLNCMNVNLLEFMALGYTVEEIEQAIRVALDHWKASKV